MRQRAHTQGPASAKGLSRDEARALGKKLREACPRSSHADWKAPKDRPDPVQLVLEAEKGRMPDLLPLRHGRMARSPFTFYRGAALTMACDLAPTPTTGIRVQCCGDAHLCNFGGFATPERRVIFSINDLDETLPAPWEWDVKRLAASFVVACRDNGISDYSGKGCGQDLRPHLSRVHGGVQPAEDSGTVVRRTERGLTWWRASRTRFFASGL